MSLFLVSLVFLASAAGLIAQEKAAPTTPATPAESEKATKAAPKKVDFASQIYPIFSKQCVECHATAKEVNGKPKKPKGNVVLDNKEGILAAKRGKVVVAGKSESSLLVESICLPDDDEDRMPPPEEGPALTKAQIQLIKDWIDGGADFGSWTGTSKPAASTKQPATEPAAQPAGKGTAKPDAKKAQKQEKSGLERAKADTKAVPEQQLEALANGPFRVQRLEPGSALLVVSAAGKTDEVNDAALNALVPIANNIIDLDLARTQVTDAACATIARMPNLLHLDLRQTSVGNGVTAIGACKLLESVNLFGTKVGDYGMAGLAGLKGLESVYVWQTEVSAAGVMRLREAVPGVRVVVAADLPEPMAEQANERRRTP